MTFDWWQISAVFAVIGGVYLTGLIVGYRWGKENAHEEIQEMFD